MIGLLIRREHEYQQSGAAPNWFGRFHAAFNDGFDRFRDFYGWLLTGILRRRIVTPAVALCVVAGAVALAFHIGSDFFPSVDAGLIQLHVRAPAGTRIERTEQIFQEVEDKIRATVDPKDLKLVLDNIGLPFRLYNLAFTDGSEIGVNDGTIQIELGEGHVAPLTEEVAAAAPAAIALAPPTACAVALPAPPLAETLAVAVALPPTPA